MKIGIDEVGYGCWAGPVMACALYFPQETKHEFFDSKSLTPKKRLILFEILKEVAIWNIGIGSVEEINEFGLAYAHKMAILRAKGDFVGDVWIDGCKPKYLECTAIIKGDQKIKEISAASIVAKVIRDELMNELDKQFPKYGFAKHKGYGTKQHINALQEHGFCEIHRTCYRLIKYLK